MCHGHSHDHGDEDAVSLYPLIDITSVRCLNESTLNSCQGVIKKYDQRDQEEPCMISNDDDPEMIMHVPFTEAVKLTNISITGDASR